jgi:hypothetical protein
MLEYLHSGQVMHVTAGGMNSALTSAALQAAQFFCLDGMRKSIWRWAKACEQPCEAAPKHDYDLVVNWEWRDEEDYGDRHIAWQNPLDRE